MSADPASVSSPRTKGGGGGVHTRRAVRGWGINISEDARHSIGLLQCNPSTVRRNLVYRVRGLAVVQIHGTATDLHMVLAAPAALHADFGHFAANVGVDSPKSTTAALPSSFR